jgi:pyroglutamyl-peptidase
MPKPRVALVTGFEPFGGYAINPSAEIARALDGTTVADTRIVGRVLPVDLGRLDRSLQRSLAEIDGAPAAVIALGLAAAEPVVRLERVALNLADFAIADNAGRQVSGRELTSGGPSARATRLPLAAIQRALLDAGIPARLSNSAGTYLCNAAMYRLLEKLPRRVKCGFIHLPSLPAEVARQIAAAGGATGESSLIHLASMELATMRRAVEIALQVTLGAVGARGSRRRAARA